MIWWPTSVPTLQSGLIVLRKPEEKDVESIFQGVQDPLIPKHTRIPADYKISNAQEFVRERSPDAFTNKSELQLTLEYGGNFVGALSFHTIDHVDAKAEIGYWLIASARGKGIATQAIKVLTGFGFESIGFCRIEALVISTNISSIKCLENSGYQREGTLRDKGRTADGSRLDMVMLAAIKSEWQ
jgi:ribosomal-protein-alanine N-acetyltransferase